MNIYDTKQVNCYRCGRWVGEVDSEAGIIYPKCGDCANPFQKESAFLPTLNKVLQTKLIKI